MISTRYAWAACLLFAVGLVPTVIHVYREPPANIAGELAKRLPADVESFAAKGSLRTATWTKSMFDTADYVSRTYPSKHTDASIELFGVASYDWKKVFHFPENGLARGHIVTRSEEKVIRGFPVRVLEFRTSVSTRVAVYTLFYGDESVTNPIGHVLGEVPRLFVSARKQMTLIYAQADGRPKLGPELEKELGELIVAAGNALRR